MAMDFSKKCEVLSELWINYKQDDNLSDFIEYNDLGLPLAYMVNTNLVNTTDEGKKYIEETYDLFCAAIGVDNEKEYNGLNEMLGDSDQS